MTNYSKYPVINGWIIMDDEDSIYRLRYLRDGFKVEMWADTDGNDKFYCLFNEDKGIEWRADTMEEIGDYWNEIRFSL